jgi:hypothetical protein
MQKKEEVVNVQSVNPQNKLDSDSIPWTESYLVNRLKQHLATVESSNKDYENNLQDHRVFDSRKYYNRAHHFLKIGVLNPVPNYVVNLSDLTPKLIKEIYELSNEKDQAFVLKQAIGRIFEDVSFELYHNSVSRVLKVELQP